VPVVVVIVKTLVAKQKKTSCFFVCAKNAVLRMKRQILRAIHWNDFLQKVCNISSKWLLLFAKFSANHIQRNFMKFNTYLVAL